MKQSHDCATEVLAQLLYDVSDTFGAPWSQRLPISRNPWQVMAERRLAALGRHARPEQQPHGSERDTISNRGERAIFELFDKYGCGARPLSLGTLVQGAGLPPELVVDALYDLIDGGLIEEMPIFSGFGDQPIFRLLPAGRISSREESGCVSPEGKRADCRSPSPLLTSHRVIEGPSKFSG